MKGSYEQQWQEVMADATVQPSDSVWENIASSMDSERGNKSWITILLVAATVTMAFAFPMTVGNSELQNRESLESFIAKRDDFRNRLNNDKNESSPSIDETTRLTKNSLAHEKPINKDAFFRTGNNLASQDDNISPDAKNQANLAPEGSTLVSFDISNFTKTTLSPVNINDYYLIPFYLPSIKHENRSLLASLNLGTGSLKAGSGLGGLGMLNSDEAFTASAIAAGPTDGRTENAGGTFYFGTGVELPIGKRWSLVAGVGYLAQKATGTSNIVLDAGTGYQPLGAYDPIVPGTIFLSESYDYSVTNRYINVPMLIKYPFVNRKIKLRGGIGISTDFMISHVLYSDSFGKANYKPSSMNYNPVVLAGLINLDVSYSLNNQYSLAIESGIRKGFTAIDENKDYYPSSFTIGVVLFYKIH